MSVKAINTTMGEFIEDNEDWPIVLSKENPFSSCVLLALQGEWSGHRVIVVDSSSDVFDPSENFDDVTRKYEGRLLSFFGGNW